MQVQQSTAEWENLGSHRMEYHLAQYEHPKHSTVAFCNFLKQVIDTTGDVIDMGCGAGAATNYFAEHFPDRHFIGIDLSPQLTHIANSNKKFPNISFEQGDWYDLADRTMVDGVVSLQTLSWLPEYEAALKAIFKKLRPKWIAMSSLFYDGEVSCKIEVTEHLYDRTSFYNVYPLKQLDAFCMRYGYRLTRSTPFKIEVDLARPKNIDIDQMGTYTVAISPPNGSHLQERLQISGPLLMNWQFIYISKV
jgi:SAM-dependent methyltransferase